MVPGGTAFASGSASSTDLHQRPPAPSKQPERDPPSCDEKAAEPTGLQSVRQTLLEDGLTDEAADLIMLSWRPNTVKAYNPYIKQWEDYVKEGNISDPSETDVINFLADLEKKGLSYSTINTARSALSAYFIKHRVYALGSQARVCRLLKGVFEKKPALPRYVDTWDVDTVLSCLTEWPSLEDIQLKDLTLRTVMLLALLSGQRGQSLHSLLVEDVKFKEDACTIVYSSVLKQTKAGSHVSPLHLPCFENTKLCIVCHLKEYITRTEPLRKDRKLFISYVKPHHAIARDTLSRWIKTVLEAAGIDSSIFAAHSTRAASTSAALNRDASLKSILDAAGWSSSCVFKKFYLRPIVGEKPMSQVLLDKFVSSMPK